MRSGERVLLRVLNAGARMIDLHTHGHCPIVTAVDGYPLPAAAQIARDVFTIGAAQRLDLELRPGRDDQYASGPGVWLMHDHTEQTTTNNGIEPGGDLPMIVYETFMGQNGLPRVVTSLDRFFDPRCDRAQVPVFDPAIFHATREHYEDGRVAVDQGGGPPLYPIREETRGTTTPGDEQQELAAHRMMATSCAPPRGFRRIVMKEGARRPPKAGCTASSPR